MDPAQVLVQLATYNEADNLPSLVERILKQDLGVGILVVDDNSPDGTGEIADRLSGQSPLVQVLHRPGKQGLGTAIIAGFRHALAAGAQAVITMDADHAHDPAALPLFLAALQEHDLVIGSRYLHGVSAVNWPLSRILVSWFANRYVRTITGLRLADCTSGYRAYRRRLLEGLPWDSFISRGYSFMVEISCRAVWQGYRVGEVPITIYGRLAGESKMTGRVLAESAVVPWRLRLAHAAGCIKPAPPP